MDAFRSAVETRDLEAMRSLLADDVVFRSPVAHKSYHGCDVTMTLLTNVMQVFQDFVYLYPVGHDGDTHQALVFEAKVSDRTVTGCDFITIGDDGLIIELMVMIRPLSGLVAVAEQMGARQEVLDVTK